MKKRFKKSTVILLSLLLCILLAAQVFAATIYNYEGYSYTDNGDYRISICGWDNRSSALVIPSRILDDYVDEIADMAFMNNEVITSVDFGSAYYLDRIGIMAFKGCVNLSGTVSLPSGLTSVETGTFEGCSSINSMRFNSPSANIPAQFCNKCYSLSEVIITDGVSSIGNYAFANCSVLETVRIPASVTSISANAFQNSANAVINCYYDSYAHHYAEDYGIDYEILDPWNIPTEPPTEPTEPETEPPTEAPIGYLLGDTDNSDYIDVVDATWIQRYAALMDVTPVINTIMHGDVDADGEATVVDATFIMRYTVNIATPYAIGERVV